MRKLCEFVLFLSLYTIVNAGQGSHSVWALATYIIGKTPFPEFTVVVMLDDIQVGYFDSNIKQSVDRGDTFVPENIEDDNSLNNAKFRAFSELQVDLKFRALHLMEQFNLTDGVHVLQGIGGCEIKSNGEPALIMFKDTFNAIHADCKIYYNMTHRSYDPGNLIRGFNQIRETFHTIGIENVYFPFCVNELKRLLEREKKLVMRIVPPRLRLIKKKVSGGVRVTCLAFGFYPRHINLTLLRDGQPVAEQELTGGEVLPSGDGTYQMRKTLEVSREELNKRHHYNCTASYLSLDNKLNVIWESEKVLINWDLPMQPSLGFTENGQKKRTYPVSGTSLGKNALLIPEVSGEWPNELIERQQ